MTSATAPPKPPTTLCSSQVTIKPWLPAHFKMVFLSSGFTVGKVYTVGLMPDSFNFSQAISISSKIAPVEKIATFSPSFTRMAFPAWKFSILSWIRFSPPRPKRNSRFRDNPQWLSLFLPLLSNLPDRTLPHPAAPS